MESILDYIEKSREEAERVGSSVKDFKVFDFSYIPEKPLVRPEPKRIVDALVQYNQTGIPRNLVIVGPRGCGKTLILDHDPCNYDPYVCWSNCNE